MPATSQPSTSSVAAVVIRSNVAFTESCARRSRAIDAICCANRPQSTFALRYPFRLDKLSFARASRGHIADG
ncbi:hypothetical protein AB5J55_01150 [Streptomyces sp. R11]|uniref:Uncharacterized protein n=1 Tax=Streptomyces sp. R11 TaxID=3238625 RepID=A0AB39MQE2_9ACTN